VRYLEGDPQLRPVEERRSLIDRLEDVPAGVVRAMGVTAGTNEHSLFVPYVYRGIGIDSIEYAAWKVSQEKRKAEQRRQEEMEIARLQNLRRRRAERARLEEQREAQAEQRARASIPLLIASIYDTIERDKARRVKAEKKTVKARKREYKRHKRRGPVRPAPGWKPPTGEDIDRWLTEYDVTD